MADLTVTAASVLKGTTGNAADGVAGTTLAAGDVLYRDSSDLSLKLADANSVTAAVRTVVGIALNGAATGQPVKYIVSDTDLTPGFSSTAGEVVILSATPGKMAPAADAASGDYVTVIGIMKSATKMKTVFIAADAAKP